MSKKVFLALTLCALLLALTACGGLLEKLLPAKAPGGTPASGPALSGPVRGEEPSAPAPDRPELAAYTEILEELCQSCRDPERFRQEEGPAFALYDADADGAEELIIRDGTGEAGRWTRIYGYDAGAGRAYLELETHPDATCYDNGALEAAWDHSQGVAGDRVWPYDLYSYDRDGGIYTRIAGVDGWDRSITEVYAGESFPVEADRDGDGYVYYILTEEGGYAPAGGEPVDNAAYEAWRASYLGGASPVQLPFAPLVRENIAALGR